MARTSTRKKVACEAGLMWQSLVSEPSRLETLDADGLGSAWQALLWAQAHEKIEPLPLPVAADASATSTVLRVVLGLLATPPGGVTAGERLLVAQWASQLRYPPLEALRAGLVAEVGRVKEAIAIFDSLKNTAGAFPEVLVTAGRTLLLHAGTDSKLLHKAEGYLLHAEHISMDGSEEAEDEEQWEGDEEVMTPDVVLDEASQQRLAEVWTLMAKLYARLGDPKKAEMYRTRAGSAVEEASDDVGPEGLEPLEGEMPDPSVLKPGDRKLIRQFIDSPYYRGLSAAQQRQAAVALPSFVSLGRLYLGLAPTRLDRYSLEELLLGLIPEKLVATMDEMAHVPAALIAWVHFLGKNGQLRDGARLVAMVQKLSGDFLANCRNPDKWSIAKTMAMQMMASGIDLDDQVEVTRYLSTRSARLLAV